MNKDPVSPRSYETLRKMHLAMCEIAEVRFQRIETLQKQVDALQLVVNAASVFVGSDDTSVDGDGEDNYEAQLSLCSAISQYREWLKTEGKIK